MKRQICTLLLLMLCSLTYAQTKNEITGKWGVEQVYFPQLPELPEENLKKIEEMKAAMEKATFVFNDNGTCSLNIALPDLAFREAKWLYNMQSRKIDIKQNNSHNFTLLNIIIEQTADGATYFQLDETEVKLKVRKI